MGDWNPARYLAFATERSRPFVDLVARIDADDPRQVADLGCGPGNLTALLAQRWPAAQIVGIDASPAMIKQAAALASDRLSFTIGDLRQWRPDEQLDVIVSNATLQWVPDHRDLLARIVDALHPGGWLAFQVPGNFAEPSHVLLRQLAADDRFAPHSAGLTYPASFDAATYLADLSELGCRVDAWETTYLHILTGTDPVFAWISGTGARPVLDALPADLRMTFEREFKALLREAYAAAEYGTVLPFRRIFVVARRGDDR